MKSKIKKKAKNWEGFYFSAKKIRICFLDCNNSLNFCLDFAY